MVIIIKMHSKLLYNRNALKNEKVFVSNQGLKQLLQKE